MSKTKPLHWHVLAVFAFGLSLPAASAWAAGETTPTEYQAFIFELGARSFTTIDGLQVVVANDERMELSGLD